MRLVILFLILFGLSGCANPSIVRVNDSEIKKITISKIYIPRFEGNPAFVEESTDLFIAELEPNISGKIVQGSVVRTESTDILSGGNLAPTELAGEHSLFLNTLETFFSDIAVQHSIEGFVVDGAAQS